MNRWPIERRFWARTEPDLNTGCVLWTGRPNSSGYGEIRIGDRRKTGAHRLAYELFVGNIPDGMSICHRCDTKLCVNPAHLFPGTAQDNTDDKMAKGRWGGGVTRGVAHLNAKLAEGDIALIRAARGHERQVDTAARFGISQVMTSRIQRGLNWTHVL